MSINALPIPTKVASKADVGLSNVDNTSDQNKPVSTAQAAADTAVGAAAASALAAHASAVAPHTKAQVGLGAVDNTADLDKPVSAAQAAALATHTGNTSNPHAVTKAQVGLANVDNTSDANKPVSTAAQAALDVLTALSGKAPFNSQTGDYTVQASDAGKRIGMNAVGASTLSLPDNTQAAIPVDTWFFVTAGTGSVCTISPLSGGTATILLEAGLSVAPLVVNAVYLVIKSSASGGWRVSKVGGTSVVNDLVTGGTTSALSAEQGKTLQLTKMGGFTTTPPATGYAVKMSKPGAGRLYSDGNAVDQEYTWATRPDPTTSGGDVITITDWNQDFFSDGANWIPVGKRLTLVQSAQPSTLTTLDGTVQVCFTDTIPAGLVLTNCRIDVEGLWVFVGAAGVKTGRFGFQGNEAINIQTTTAGGIVLPARQTIWVGNQANEVHFGSNSANASGYYNNGSAAFTSFANYAFTAAVAMQWRMLGTGPDQGQLKSRSIVVVYP